MYDTYAVEIRNKLIFFQNMPTILYETTYKKSPRIPFVETSQSKMAAEIPSQCIGANNFPTNCHKKAKLVKKKTFLYMRKLMPCVKLKSGDS